MSELRDPEKLCDCGVWLVQDARGWLDVETMRPHSCGRETERKRTMTIDEKRDTALRVCWALYGTQYVWGGDDPMSGFDCSGLIVEALQSAGVLPHGTDYTSQQLRQQFATREISIDAAKHTPGALIFYGTGLAKIEHVAMSLGNGTAIQAAGGGQATTSPGAAERANAFVKVRPFNYRGVPIAAVDPFA